MPGPSTSSMSSGPAMSWPPAQRSVTRSSLPHPAWRARTGGPAGSALWRSPHSRRASRMGVSSRPVSVMRYSWRGWGPGPPGLPPLPEGQQDGRQLATRFRHAVLVAGSAAGLAVLRPLEDALVDELGQPLGQEVARALQHLVELLEARRAVEALPKNQQRPLLADDLQGAGDRAVTGLVVRALHPHEVSRLSCFFGHRCARFRS